MIKEDYVSFECAKLLKEKGFDEDTICVYIGRHLLIKGEGTISNNTDMPIIPAPTLQMAMKYLRERYKLNIIISIDDLDWFYSIIDYTHKGDVKMLKDLAGFNSYESACEAAIIECLTNLI